MRFEIENKKCILYDGIDLEFKNGKKINGVKGKILISLQDLSETEVVQRRTHWFVFTDSFLSGVFLTSIGIGKFLKRFASKFLESFELELFFVVGVFNFPHGIVTFWYFKFLETINNLLRFFHNSGVLGIYIYLLYTQH